MSDKDFLKKLLKLSISMSLFVLFIVISGYVVYAQPTNEIIYQPNLDSLSAGEILPNQQFVEGTGFVSDGNGGLVSTTDDEYNAIYFGTSVRQFHYHAVMEPVNPGTSVVGGLSFKTFSFDEGKRMDLAITTGTTDKSILIYAFGVLLADNRNGNQGGLGGLNAFNTSDSITIDLYGDRNYYAVFINGTIVIETVLPIEGTGVFGIRSQNSLVRYSDIYIEKLGSTLLDGRARYYPETFETISLKVDKTEVLREEPFNISAILLPDGMDYDDVQWYLDDVLIINETDLTIPMKIGSQGEHEVSCIVDRQKATIAITVSESLYVDTNPNPNPEPEPEPEVKSFPVLAIVLISVGGVGLIAGSYILFIKKK